MVARDTWSDVQNDATIAAYFTMLDDDAAGRPHKKSERRRALEVVIGHDEESIAYKQQNISAVPKGLGKTRIDSYKLPFNFRLRLKTRLRVGLPNGLTGLRMLFGSTKRKALGCTTRAPLIRWPPNVCNAPTPDAPEQMLLANEFANAGGCEVWRFAAFPVVCSSIAIELVDAIYEAIRISRIEGERQRSLLYYNSTNEELCTGEN